MSVDPIRCKTLSYDSLSYDSAWFDQLLWEQIDFDFTVGQCLVSDENSAR